MNEELKPHAPASSETNLANVSADQADQWESRLENSQLLEDAELLNTIDLGPVEMQAFSRMSILWMTIVVEGGLALLAVGLAYWLEVPLFETFRWNPQELGIGLAAAVPMMGVLFLTARSQLAPFVRIRQLLDEGLFPRLKACKFWDLIFLAAMAGFCEELLFRTVIQQYLENVIHPIWGLVIASVVFGLLHCVSMTYAILTFVAGIYLGAIWWVTGRNSVAVMIAHGVYDWVAFVYLMKLHRARATAE